ncbi:MAG: hypothetical protein ACLVJ6_15995 [Merdibacter sp.]
MEELIKNIVEADKAARGRINEKIHERDNVHSQILKSAAMSFPSIRKKAGNGSKKGVRSWKKS